MPRSTGARVLVVEDDLDQHKVIHDILEMTLKDARIERVMNPAALLNKLRRPKVQYNLILFDLTFHDASGAKVLQFIRAEMPELEPKTVLLVNSSAEYEATEAARGLRYILKPFSLDSFTDTVREVCGT